MGLMPGSRGTYPTLWTITRFVDVLSGKPVYDTTNQYNISDEIYCTTMPRMKTLVFMTTVLKGLIHGVSGSVIRQMAPAHSAQRKWPLL